LSHRYWQITEAPGQKASREQVARIYHRYRLALDYARGVEVFEAACGSGISLGYLAGVARRVVGGDIDVVNISAARDARRALTADIREKVDIVRLDAHHLSFSPGSFDLVLLFEAVYYLKDPGLFVTEAARVLRDGGTLIVGTVNKDWPDFHPSPYTHYYPSVPDLYRLLRSSFASVAIYGAFPSRPEGVRQSAISMLKRVAVRFDLIPGSLKARSYLKRLFLGPLADLPGQITEGMADYDPPRPLPADRIDTVHKILYAVARK